MKTLLLSLLVISGTLTAKAQLTLTPNQTAQQLASTIVATSGTLGVVVTNQTLTCDSNSNGLFAGPSNLGISNGIVLGNGDVMTSGTTPGITYGLNGLPGDFASTAANTPGDSLLTALFNITTYDACVLEFDLQPVGNFVEFEYVFGSEEYPEFNCSVFNDMFGFFISGPGFAPNTNIALLPNSVVPVSINSINDSTGGNCAVSSSLYVVNNDTTNTMDGFTMPLIAHVNVTPNQVYHLKMAVADAADMVLNSYVLLRANSLKSGNTNPSSVNNLSQSKELSVYPTLMSNELTVENKGNKTWKATLFDLQGRVNMKWEITTSSGKNKIDISHLTEGIYFLKISDTEGNIQFCEKIVKQ